MFSHNDMRIIKLATILLQDHKELVNDDLIHKSIDSIISSFLLPFDSMASIVNELKRRFNIK